MLFSTLATAAFAGIAAAAPLEARKAAPSTYKQHLLEDYATYHLRYIALDCHTKHNTTFFNECCRPMLASQNLSETRADYCAPNETAIASASARIARVKATATVPVAADAAQPTESAPPADEVDVADDAGKVWESVTTQIPAASPTPEAEQAPAPEPTPQAAALAAEDPAPAPAPEEPKPEEPKPEEPKQEKPSGDQHHGGVATFYEQNGVAGACGDVHQDSDYVAALSTFTYYPNTAIRSEYCGRQVLITNNNNGKTVTVTIQDACPTCKNGESIDLSHAAFNTIATPEEGMVPITWQFI